jgi:HK97 family phage portal protein
VAGKNKTSVWTRLGRKIAGSLKSFRFSTLGGQRGYGGGLHDFVTGGLLGGSSYDYAKEAGVLWENGIVHTCIQWVLDTYPEAQLVVQRPNGTKWDTILNHPITAKMERPNPDYDGSILMAGVLISYFCDGNAYIYLDRSAAGKIVNLYYVPHWMIEPKWSGGDYISNYEYTVDGISQIFPRENVIHIRNGVDPANTRKGLSRLKAYLREICTDNEAATLVASLLRNQGVPGVFISPEVVTDKQGNQVMMSEPARNKIRDTWGEKYGGDSRGEPFVSSLPVKVVPLSFNPQQLVVDKIRHIPEERVTSGFGIPPQVLGLGAGLEHGDYNNYEIGVEIAYHRCLKPTGKRVALALTHAFDDEPGYEMEAGARIGYDYSEITALQPDVTEQHTRAVDDFQGGLITLNEGRAEINQPKVTDGDKFIWGYTGGIKAAQQSAGQKGDET